MTVPCLRSGTARRSAHGMTPYALPYSPLPVSAARRPSSTGIEVMW
jgi:hypothetical protein